jgi:hypothetical protein
MAISSRSNRSLSRFWGIVLALTFYGFVMAGLFGFPRKAAPDLASGGPARIAAVPRPADNGSASAAQSAPAAEAASARPDAGTALAAVASSDSEASASASMVVGPVDVPSVQPGSGTVPPGAGATPPSRPATAQVATLEIAAKPVGVAGSPPAWTDLVRRCSNGRWTWQSTSCPVPARRVVWRWARSCAVRLGNLCLGPHYVRVQVVTTDAAPADTHGGVWR